MKTLEIFWNTKFQLNFQSSSAAALIKKLSDGKFKKLCGTSGHSFWIRANGRWFGQRGVEKKSQKTPNFIVTKFLPCQLFATGMSNMYTVCPEEQFKVQTSLRKRNNFNRNWTKSWVFFEISEKNWRSLSKNFLAALSEPKLSCPSVYFAKSIFLRQLINFENLLDFNKRKHSSTRSERFLGKSLFLSHLMAK